MADRANFFYDASTQEEMMLKMVNAQFNHPPAECFDR
jgi:hypothetical protein